MQGRGESDMQGRGESTFLEDVGQAWAREFDREDVLNQYKDFIDRGRPGGERRFWEPYITPIVEYALRGTNIYDVLLPVIEEQWGLVDTIPYRLEQLRSEIGKAFKRKSKS